MLSQSIIAITSSARLLFRRWKTLALLLAVYAALLTAVYVFVGTREATVGQLIVTLALFVVAPALFFLLQAITINFANDSTARKLLSDCLRLIVVSVPVIALTFAAIYGLNKLDTLPTLTTTLRYLLLGVVAPLLAIQLWIATSRGGLRSVTRKVLTRTFAPQSVFVYACGFLIFAVAPYFLILKTVPTERAWLEFSLLVLRLSTGAVLILLGWATTVGAISNLNQKQ